MIADLDISYTEIAFIGTLTNLGIGVACLFVSFIFTKFKIKHILFVTLLLNSGFGILFSYSFNLASLYVSRFFMGLS